MTTIPAYDSAIIILFSVLLPAACWLGVQAAALPGDRRLVSSATALFLGVWTFARPDALHRGRVSSRRGEAHPRPVQRRPAVGQRTVDRLDLFLAVAPFRRTLDAVRTPGSSGCRSGDDGFLVLSLGLWASAHGLPVRRLGR